MVSVAPRSPFASHRRLPPALHAERGHRGARRVAPLAATRTGDSRPPLSHPPAALLEVKVLLLADAAPPPQASVVDNGGSAPRPDASAATTTSRGSPLRFAR